MKREDGESGAPFRRHALDFWLLRGQLQGSPAPDPRPRRTSPGSYLLKHHTCCLAENLFEEDDTAFARAHAKHGPVVNDFNLTCSTTRGKHYQT